MGKELPQVKIMNTINYERHYSSGMPQIVQMRSETERSFGKTFREVQSKVYNRYSSRNLSQYNDSQMASGGDLFAGQSVFRSGMHEKIFGVQPRNWSLEPAETSAANPQLTPAFRNLAQTQQSGRYSAFLDEQNRERESHISLLQNSQYHTNTDGIESVIKELNDNITAARRNTESGLRAYETERSRRVIKNFRSQQNRAKFRKRVFDGMSRVHVFNAY